MKTTRIDPRAVKEKLTTVTLGQSVVFYEQTGSTNADAKALGRTGAPHGTLVLCARQTDGRGRRGRSWLSEENAGCMTALLRPEFPMEFAPRYVIALAVGVCRALRSFGANARIKWPNDILADGKKLCGILLEADASGFVAAGVGVNVNQKDFPEDIAASAGSLLSATGREADPNEVAAVILNACEPLVNACGSDEGYTALLETYRSLSLTLGSRVRVFAPEAEYTGTAIGLDPLGMLIVKKDSGETVTVGAGDVTIRGTNDD
jgi:BirA family biotin operon repressor/biotin-[acetyl-CoA-carboxylase] ligase